MSSRDGFGDPSASRYMVFLDQKGVVKADPMVIATATGHCVLLRQTQTGNSFAGVQQADTSTFNKIGKVSAPGSDTRQRLQKIQCRTFTAEQRSRRPFEMKQHAISSNLLAINNLPVHRNPRIELAKYCIHPSRTTDDSRLASDDRSMAEPLGRDQLRRDVAGTDILGQSFAHIGFDFGGKIRKSEIGHDGLPLNSARV